MIALIADAYAIRRDGYTRKGPVNAAKVQDAAAAIDSLEHGAEQVFVREGDAEKVRAWVKGQGETPYALGSSE